MDKVVLAYSGGLDTSYCVKYLINELKLEVHSVLVNTGGFTKEELATVEKKAYEMGVTSHKNKDILEKYYDKAIKYMVYGNVLKNNTYPLSVSAERVFQSIEVVKYAKSVGAKYIAHGSTGAGNDQVRFDMIFQTIAPEIEIITPIRDLKLSRQTEIDYLKSHGVDMNWEKSKYSVNKGIWGTSVGGVETLKSQKALPSEAYPSQLKREDEEEVTLTFEKGQLVAFNGVKDTPVNNILKLEEIASAFAIGRDIHVGDTIVGIKGRVGFEAAAATVIIKAHHLLEKHTLSKAQQITKEGLATTYGTFFHDGQYLEPLMRNIEKFLEDSQSTVSGDVYVTLRPYHFITTGIDSKYDLMASGFADYGEENNAWSSQDAKGFIKIYGMQNKIFYHVNKDLLDA
ncbi:argininosuccinate synthase [Wenyingzhuangia sp. 2_MG-2023]|uniref:argininosuccinate synthase n=1 Tax=Wenyingzhuangia sp. 2_MG-2023 TaxID=3062639 RepID=UPI0026E26A3A|nr:argininosuccinate synthase domain-containing protein [Wenyingzhuangia sp. 2_MG-2023]MDO6736822.1 argininosuccinate synthase [Wenyingzhuangia sp. 2_MG-2023]